MSTIFQGRKAKHEPAAPPHMRGVELAQTIDLPAATGTEAALRRTIWEADKELTVLSDKLRTLYKQTKKIEAKVNEAHRRKHAAHVAIAGITKVPSPKPPRTRAPRTPPPDPAMLKLINSLPQETQAKLRALIMKGA